MTGSALKVHLPFFTSNWSGTHNSRRCPTAEDNTNWSLSKYSSCFVKPASALAISPATDGFSAMISVLPIANRGLLQSGAARGNPMFYRLPSNSLEDEVKSKGRMQLRHIEISRRDGDETCIILLKTRGS